MMRCFEGHEARLGNLGDRQPLPALPRSTVSRLTTR